MIKRISCIEIPVSDIEKAVAFYENVLGLKKSYEHPVWTCFDVGGVLVGLAASGTKKRKECQKICRACSVCVLRYASSSMKQDKEAPVATYGIYFEVENLNKTYKKLKEQGVKFVTKPKEQGWGEKTAIMLDHDNNIIVLIETRQD